MRLRRVSTTAEEGVFTCNITGDINTPGYLGVYYPSELLCNVYDERERTEHHLALHILISVHSSYLLLTPILLYTI